MTVSERGVPGVMQGGIYTMVRVVPYPPGWYGGIPTSPLTSQNSLFLHFPVCSKGEQGWEEGSWEG